jgi:4Fe-4S ferredoxin
MFPKVKREKINDISKTKVQYLMNSVGMEIDEHNCQGCGICVKICPVSAMDRGPIGVAKKGLLANVIPTLVDPVKCSYCGLCSYLCPWSAIVLQKDEENQPIEELDIVKKKAVPTLVYEMIKCKEGIPDAKSYLEGELTITTSKCAGGCNTCIEICPTGALSVTKSKDPWEKGREIVVDNDKCFLCGTCTNACPVFDAMKLKITKVKSEGDFNSIMWDAVVEKLKISRMRNGKKIN